MAGTSAGQKCVLRVEDLHSFQSSLERLLAVAYRALDIADKDLCQLLGRIVKHVVELTQSASMVVEAHRMMAQRIMCDLLPRFRLAAAGASSDSEAVDVATAVQTVISKMKNDAKVIRSLYINVLATVQYLISCTQVSLDFFQGNDSSEDVLEAMPESSSKDAPHYLKVALEALRHVHHILADPSDFWLIFHVIELELGSLEQSAQLFLTALRTGGANRSVACEALEHLCMQYLAVRKFPA